MNLQFFSSDLVREFKLVIRLRTVWFTVVAYLIQQAMFWGAYLRDVPVLPQSLYDISMLLLLATGTLEYVETTTMATHWNFRLPPWRNLLPKTITADLLALCIVLLELPWYFTYGTYLLNPAQIAGMLLTVVWWQQIALWCMMFSGTMRMVMSLPAVLPLLLCDWELMPATGLDTIFAIPLLVFIVGGTMLAFCFGLIMRSDPRPNRAASARWTIFGLWIAMLIALFAGLRNVHLALDFWSKLSLLFSVGLMATAAGERLDPSREMIEQAPATKYRRLFSLVFASGTATGMLVGKGMLFAGAAIQLALHMDWSKLWSYQAWHQADLAIAPIMVVPLYVFFYGAVVILLRRNLGMTRFRAAALVVAVFNLPAIAALFGWKYAAVTSIFIQYFIDSHIAMIPATILAVLAYFMLLLEWVFYARQYFKLNENKR